MSDEAQGRGSRVVDVCTMHYDLLGWEVYLGGFADDAPAYLEKFAHRFCAIAGADAGTFQARLSADPRSAVSYLLSCGGGFDISFEQYARDLEAQGVAFAVLQSCPWAVARPEIHDRMSACARERPDLCTAWAGLSLREPARSLQELDRCVDDLGMTGATLIPCLEDRSASDPAATPLYERLSERGLPVWIHTGHNFNNRAPLDRSHWRHIDAVATAFPDLKILVGHGGWPWIAEVVSLCLRHRNVYLEFSSHRPKFMPRSGSGWESLLFHAAGAMHDRVLFGTSGWTSIKTPAQLAEEVRELPLPAEVAERWLVGNAVRALGLSPRTR